jgi:hypothetical protein
MKKILILILISTGCSKELHKPTTVKMVVEREFFNPSEHFHVGYFCFDIDEIRFIETDTLYLDKFKKR